MEMMAMTGDSDGQALLRSKLPALGEETPEQVIERTWDEIKGLDHSQYKTMTVMPLFSPAGTRAPAKITFRKTDGKIVGEYQEARVWLS